MVVGVELEQELDCRGRRRVHVPVHAAHGSGLDVPGTLLVAPPCVERSPRRVPVYPLWKILGLVVGGMGLRRRWRGVGGAEEEHDVRIRKLHRQHCPFVPVRDDIHVYLPYPSIRSPPPPGRFCPSF